MRAMRLPVALVQLDATDDVDANIATRRRRSPTRPPPAAPGSSPCPSTSSSAARDDGFRASARPVPGPFTDAFAEVARRHDAWILVGSLAETSADPARPHNTSVLIAPTGDDRGHVPQDPPVRRRGRRRVRSTPSRRASRPATRRSSPTSTASRVGLSICYDLRFPELYRSLALAGAEVLTVPANFTERTGRDHWEVLLRARAIENGAWVLAPSQIGGPPGQPAYGRSMIIDPWGTVVAQAGDTRRHHPGGRRDGPRRRGPSSDPCAGQPSSGGLSLRRSSSRAAGRRRPM